ncbi:MAG: hypothetical protein FWH27_07865 [Planctomycetaceae bacterium]|nr:hypothetical protein [Planctomycetaceae bacterium]
MKRVLIFALFFSVVFALGCSKGNIQLGGTVTFEDGTPLTVGAVCFSTDSFMASGNIDSHGKYVMGSYGVNDGLPKGTYKIYISGATEEISGRGGISMYSLIDPRFADYSSTPLTCEIPAPNNTFDIKVPQNPQSKP